MRQGLMIYPHHMLQTLGKYGAAPFNSASHSGEAAAAAGLDDGMLTPRQQDVLLLLARGLSNKAIASQLEISESTVKVHIHDIMRSEESRVGKGVGSTGKIWGWPIH